MQDEYFLSTDLVEPGLRNDLWREITRPFFETTPDTAHGETILAGSVTSRALGTLLVGPTGFNRQHYSRDRRLVLQSGLDHYLIQLFTAGTFDGDAEGRTIAVSAGDVCVFDLARSFTTRVTTGATLSVAMPRDVLDKAVGGRSLHGLVLKASSPVTRLVADVIISLSQMPAAIDPAEARAVDEAATALIARVLAGRAGDTALDDVALAPVLRRRVLDFIDAHLAQPDLGPALLTQRFRVSRAHLYRMFASDGGIARVIRDRRLDAAYQALRRGGTALSITQIAHELGFTNSSQFLRAFRARFGIRPSDARGEEVGAAASRQLAEVQTHFAAWVRQVGKTRAS